MFTFVLFCSSLSFGQVTITSFPYVEDFEGEIQCPGGCGDVCPLQGDFTNDLTDQLDWSSDQSGTSSGSTGPSVDHTFGTSAGTYLYIESSCSGTGYPNRVARLETPIFDLAAGIGYELQIFYHFYGYSLPNGGSLELQYRTYTNNTAGAWTSYIVLASNTNLGDQWNGGRLPIGFLSGNMVQFRFIGTTGNSFGSDMAIDDFGIFSLAPNDAQIASIDQPMSPITPGTQNVFATVGNTGGNVITSADIGWSVNGVAQTPASFSGNLTPGQTSSSIDLGSFTFNPGLSTICVWTQNPNGVTDPAPNNDTMCITVCDGIAGTYTLGTLASDFPTFDDLIDVLSECGINGPVTIEVAPGSYGENLAFTKVPGASMTNTITIDGIDTSMVEIVASSGAVVDLNGADHFHFKNLTIRNTGDDDAYGFLLRDTADHNSVDACLISMIETNGQSDVIGVGATNNPNSSFNEGQNANNFTLSNSTILGGEKSVHFEGQSSNATAGNQFLNNMLIGAEDYGISLDDQVGVVISGNTIQGISNNDGNGISCFDITDFDISGNTVLNIPDFALYISDGNLFTSETPTQRGKIVNNQLSSISDFGMYLDDVTEIDIFHNSVYNTSTFSGACRINDFSDLDIRNNIFVSDGDYAFEADEATTNTTNTIDYNTYFTGPASGTKFVDDGPDLYADLAAWQAGRAAYNGSSIEADPVFEELAISLLPLAAAINDAGDNSVGVPVDIEGTTRPLAPSSQVDMGALEFNVRMNDAVAVDFYNIASSGCGDPNTEVYVIIRSLGTNPITNMAISVEVSGGVNQSFSTNYTGPLNFQEFDTVMLGSFDATLGGSFTFAGKVDLAGDEKSANDSFPVLEAIYIPNSPQYIGGSGCGTDATYLVGAPYSGVAYSWYDSDTSSTPIFTGDSLFVPSISTKDTYYLEYLTGSGGSLETTYAGGNGQSGNIFDIQANTSTVITGFSGNFNGGNIVVDVYYRVGSYTQSPNSSSGWVQVVSGASFTSPGNGVPTRIPATLNIPVTAGQVYGVYIICSIGGVAYTNGTVVGTPFASDAFITIFEGDGRGFPAFTGGVFSPRVWNGTIHYLGEPCSNTRVPATAYVGQPGVTDLGADQTVCGTTTLLDAGNPGAINYAWNTGDDTQTLDVTSSGMYSVEVIDTGGCPSSDTVDIQILGGTGAPQAPNATYSICGNTAVNFVIQNHVDTNGNGVSGNYFWSASSVAGVGGISTSPQSGGIITDFLTNSTGSPQTVVYTVIPDVVGCNGNSFTVTVTVEENSAVQVLPGNTSFCVGQQVDIASLVRDYSATARRFRFFDADPAMGGQQIGTARTFRGAARDKFYVYPMQTSTYWVTSNAAVGCSGAIPILITIDPNCGGAVLPMVMLEGAFDPATGVQRTKLQRLQLIPDIEPYSAMGYQFVGGAANITMTAAAKQNPALVDWVVVELRDATDPTNVLFSQAALLMEDGRIVDVDGISEVRANLSNQSNYYVAVLHRNHLGVMTANPVGLGTGVEFFDPGMQIYGSGNSRLIQTNEALLFSGDADGNGQIQNTDDVLHWQPEAGTAGYKNADFNMDGQVQNVERVFIWTKNVGRGTGIPK